MPRFELVIPAYNEARSLPELVDRTVAAAVARGLGPEDFRLVLVDNGSTDATPVVLKILAATSKGPWLRLVRVERNRGYGHGLATGLAATTAAVVGWTHADLQTDPADAFRAFERVATADQAVLVKGSRLGRRAPERFVSRVFAASARLFLGLRETEINAQPKVFPRTLLGAMTAPPEGFAFDVYALFVAARASCAIESIAVRFPPRRHGLSRWAATLAGRARTIGGMITYLARLARQEGRL